MTFNGWATVVAGTAALAAWLGLGYPAPLAFAVLCGILLASGSWVRLPSGGTVTVELTGAAHRVARGDTVTVEIVADRRATVRLRPRRTSGEAAAPDSTLELSKGAAATWVSPPLPRGRLVLGVEEAVTTDWLALWRRRLRVRSTAPAITVTPRLIDVAVPPEVVDHERDGRPAPGPSGMGTVFAGLRAYRPGDDVRHIDWSASARAADHQLFVRQFAPAIIDDVLVQLDTYRPPDAPAEAFETAVDLAWSLARAGATVRIGSTPPGRDDALIEVGATGAPETGRPGATVVITLVAGRARPPDGLVLVVTGEPGAALAAAAAWNRWARR